MKPTTYRLLAKLLMTGKLKMLEEQLAPFLVERDLDARFDLPPGRPSLITRVWPVDSRRFRVGQARRARGRQIAQVRGVLVPGFCSPARNVA